MNKDPTAGVPVPGQLLTVVICTRNRETLLLECAQNVIRQIEDDTQLLIVENACTDNTLQVAQALAAAHPCVGS